MSTYLALNYSTIRLNEFLIRQWTVSGLFYTKGCEQWVVDKLKELSNELSFKEYINGAYWYRTIKLGTPKYIIKVFTIYRIDAITSTWKIVYIPKNPDYDIEIDEPNNTFRAVPKQDIERKAA